MEREKSQIHVTWPLQSQICWWSMTMAWLVRFRLFSARVLASFDPSAPSKSPASLIKLIKWYQNMLIILYIKTHLSILHMQKDSYISKSLLRKTSSCLVGGVIPSVVLHLEELLLQNGLLSLGALQHMLVHFFAQQGVLRSFVESGGKQQNAKTSSWWWNQIPPANPNKLKTPTMTNFP